MIRAAVFDLDDTLYLESQYVRSGFRSVAQNIERLAAIPKERIFDLLWSLFEQGVRGNTFDKLFEAFPDAANHLAIDDLIQAYRSHSPSLTLIPEISGLIEDLQAKGLRLGIISDGPLISQLAKVQALHLEKQFESIILTDQWGRAFWKPHPKAYKALAQTWNLQSSEMMYIGDNPEKDFIGCNNLGWHTVRLRIPGQQRFALEAPSAAHKAALEADSITRLRELIANIAPEGRI